ncbi:hypothetical protein CROQUDRAFT_97034 [Cronartium quercuum f. sp. fusiforme G11]|uniref:DUF1793-domain-containing protein n=1 Tax=Cronartium quercuum f. sp. fusiforme G11 TaxID=708437 RepID=A0A9P6T8S8_9BASI|nr:hypothetical protein CROQUDRAFT_97034 [Cronartium quercuum f. sp. fusiforme G11]
MIKFSLLSLFFIIYIINPIKLSSIHSNQIPISLPNSPSNNNNINNYNQNSTFDPLLPPAIPLAVRSPYLSAWLATGSEGGNGGYLSGRWAQFWPIQFPSTPHHYRLGWSGLIRINNKTYQFMGHPNEDFEIGNNGLIANQISFEYTSTRSIFIFQVEKVKFQVMFLSPIGPTNDLLRQSLPFSYLSIEILENEDQSKIEIYTDIQADWASGDHNANITWQFNQNQHSVDYSLQRLNPLVFSEECEYAEWGQAIYSTIVTPELTTGSAYAPELRSQFVANGKLRNKHDNEFRKINDRTPSFGYASPLTTNKPIVYVIGHVRDPYVNYVRSGSQESRSGYWRTSFNTTTEALEFSLKDYENALKESTKIDEQIYADAIRTSGSNHAAIVSLSTRQALGTFEITVGKDQDGNFNKSDVQAFLKEISSNGDMSTVDVIFPQFPILTYYDPALLKYMLDPIFEYSESGLYPNKWTVHDLGRYPNATGYNDGQDEPMPVEEAGNILIMTLAYHQLTNNTAWLHQHYDILSQWTSFLVEDGLVTAEQLSTDDFAGTLANQTDLAIKAIIGIGAMAEISLSTDHFSDASKFRKIAEDYVIKWMEYAISIDKTHTKLAYQLEDSWGTLYNLFADRLLNLNLVPHSVYEMQSTFYPLVANTYGVPLDSRRTWAKTDWEMFAAGTATSSNDRDLFINKLFDYLQANLVNAAFPDLYETETAKFPGRSNTSTWRIEFINRPVSGGHFSLLALDKMTKVNKMNHYSEYFPNKNYNWNWVGIWEKFKILFEKLIKFLF